MNFHTLVKTSGIKTAVDLLIQINLVDISLAMSLTPVPLSTAFRSSCEDMNRHCWESLRKQNAEADHSLLKACPFHKEIHTHEKRESQNK